MIFLINTKVIYTCTNVISNISDLKKMTYMDFSCRPRTCRA